MIFINPDHHYTEVSNSLMKAKQNRTSGFKKQKQNEVFFCHSAELLNKLAIF